MGKNSRRNGKFNKQRQEANRNFDSLVKQATKGYTESVEETKSIHQVVDQTKSTTNNNTGTILKVPSNSEYDEIQNLTCASEQVKDALVRLHQTHKDVKDEILAMLKHIGEAKTGLHKLTRIEIVAPHILDLDESDDVDGYIIETIEAFGIDGDDLPEEWIGKAYLVQFTFTIDGYDIYVRCASIHHSKEENSDTLSSTLIGPWTIIPE